MKRIVDCLNGRIQKGDWVVSLPTEEYGGLVGQVISINMQQEKILVSVNFENEYSYHRKNELLLAFQVQHNLPRAEYQIDRIVIAPDKLLKFDPTSGDRDRLLDSGEYLSNWCINEILKNRLLRVKTPHGYLLAQAASDPDYPGIYLSLWDTKEHIEKSIALAEATTACPLEGTNSLRLLVWRTMEGDEDYTDVFTLQKRVE